MIQSIIPYTGSSRRMIEHVLPFIPVESEVFIEAFCGSCAVTINLLQTRPNHFKNIIASDINKDLINFWNYVKSTPSSFKNDLSNFLISHSIDAINDTEPFETDLEDMLRFYLKLAYAPMSCVNKNVSELDLAKPRSGIFSKSLDNLERLSEIIQPVEFLNYSYKDSISTGLSYNLNTCCFADPPYKVDFLEKVLWYANDLVDLADLHELLSKCQSFIVSHSEDMVFEAIFKQYRGKLVEIPNTYGWTRKEIYKYK